LNSLKIGDSRALLRDHVAGKNGIVAVFGDVDSRA